MNKPTYMLKDGTELNTNTPEGCRNIRYLIAKRLYTVLSRPAAGIPIFWFYEGDEEWSSIYICTDTEDEAWNALVDEDRCPNWTDSASDALDSFENVPDNISAGVMRDFLPNGRRGRWEATVLNNTDMSSVERYDDTPAMALCLAWLAYKDAEEAGK